MPKDTRVSRRLWLTQAALITAAAGMPPLAPSTSSAQGKASKLVVHYRDYPKREQMCGMCKFFEGRGMMGGRNGWWNDDGRRNGGWDDGWRNDGTWNDVW
jgi:hypothetical protein